MKAERCKLNLAIEALMMLCLMAMAGLGFLMKWVLPPGPDRRVTYGRNVELLLSGSGRHQWGTLHLTIGFVLLALLAIHPVLHWSQIVSIYRRSVASRTARWVIALAFSLVCAFLIAFPLLVRPEVREVGGQRGRGRAAAVSLDARELAGLPQALPGLCAGCGGRDVPTCPLRP